MNNLYKVVLVWIILSISIYANPISDASKSVVRIIIETQRGVVSGTAFCVHDNYYITNHHVISDSILHGYSVHAIKEVTPSLSLYQVDIISYSEDKDLAILKIDGLGLAPLNFSSNSYAEGALSINAIGFPGGADLIDLNNKGTSRTKNFITPKISKGIIASSPFKVKLFANALQETIVIQHDSAINHGNSGGPLVDDCGNVLGVNEQKAIDVRDTIQGIFYAVSVDEVKVLLDNQNIPYNEINGVCSEDNSLYKVLFFITIFLLVLFFILNGRNDNKKRAKDNSIALQDSKQDEKSSLFKLFPEDNRLPIIVFHLDI